MRALDINTAVSQIRQACEDNRHPFFFLVGAGISKPPLPLASEIESECRKKAEAYGRKEDPPGKRPIDTYSHWFDRAFPHPAQRQEYLRTLMADKPISPANFRLAHLLLDMSVGNLVVTTNFDNFLSRALGLFGKRHVICDHPRTVDRIVVDQDNVQIVHVHGTYWFYDCCNLRGEIEERSKVSSHTAFTMASLLDEILRHRSPLVVGYAGWEGDVVMTALERRLQGRLPYNLYWFCYRKDEWKLLPEWLREHPDVYFVLPEQVRLTTPAEAESRGETAPPQASQKELAASTLSAQDVFDAMIKAFSLPPPESTSSPLTFFARQLDTAILKDDSGQPIADTYYISDVTEWLLTLPPPASISPLRPMRDALRTSRYAEAIRLGIELRKQNPKLTETDLAMLMGDLIRALKRLNEPCEEEIEAYDLVLEIGRSLPDYGAGGVARQELLAKAIVDRGLALGRRNLSAQELEAYEEAIRSFSDAESPKVRRHALRALVNKAITLDELGKQQEALALYEDVRSRFPKSIPEYAERLSTALLNRAFLMGHTGAKAEAQAAYAELAESFKDSDDPGVREHVATALNNIAYEKLCTAKEVWAASGAQAAREELAAAHQTILKALEYYPTYPVALGNRGYIEFLLGNEQEARDVLSRAIALGGEQTREDELNDSKLFPVAADEEFQKLVRAIPAQAGR